MSKLIMFCSIIAAVIFIATCQESMLGPGRWFVINISKCKDDEKYAHQFEITRKKVNRTHDGFTARMNLSVPIDESFGVNITVCKYVDGGCKMYQVLSDESFVGFVNKYAKNNVEKALGLAGLERTEFPVDAGFLEIVNYVFDYCELPTDGVYGLFDADGYLILDDVPVGCVHFTLEFKDVDDDKCSS